MKTKIIYAFIVAALATLCSCASHDAVVYTLSLPHNEVILDSSESSFKVTYIGNAEVKADVQGASWLQVTQIDKVGNCIKMKAEANDTDSQRSATLAITNTSSNETLLVKILQVASTDEFFDGSDYVVYSHNKVFKLRQTQSSLFAVEPADDWIKVNKTKDSSSGIEVTTLEIEQNPLPTERFTSVSITTDQGRRAVSVYQMGNFDHIYLGVVHSDKTFAPEVTKRMHQSRTPLTEVNWGDGQTGQIEVGGHTYTSDSQHSVDIDCWGVDNLTIRTIGSISELTFGRHK